MQILSAGFCLADDPLQIRVLSYNVHHCRGMDDRIDLPRIAKIITDSQADFVALQEIDRITRRSGGVDQAAELGRLTEMKSAFFKAIDFDGGQYGQAILAKSEFVEQRTILLPNLENREQRIVGVGTFRASGRVLQFCTVHLDHAHSELRLQQAEHIVREFSGEKIEQLTVLAGDFNAGRASQPIDLMSSRFDFVGLENDRLLTFPSSVPKTQIDFIALRKNPAWGVVKIEVLDQAEASDHRPILATLKLN